MSDFTTKITWAVAGTAILLCAADAWKNPDYTQWSTEDAQKVLTKSPWVKETSVSMGESGSGGGQGSRRGGGGGGMGGGGMGGGGSRGGGMGGGDSDGMGQRQAPPAQKIVIRWESAMPVKEASMKAKFGAQLPAKGDPGYTLDQPQTSYVISVAGLRLGGGRRRPAADSGSSEQPSADAQKAQADRIKNQLMGVTQLVRKGKDPIFPQDVVVNPTTNMVVFVFPKTDGISDDDKEVEFVTKVGPMQIKQKFSLKDMHFNGKLEL